MESPNCEFERHRSRLICSIVACCLGANQFDCQSIGIGEGDNWFIETFEWTLKGDAPLSQSRSPEVDAGLRDCKCGVGHLTGSPPTLRSVRPGKESQDRARMSDAVTVIKMICTRVVEVHRQFHQAQAEDVGVEIDIRLRITCDRGDMVDSEELFVHLVRLPDCKLALARLDFQCDGHLIAYESSCW
jgi:hypothetical protein